MLSAAIHFTYTVCHHRLSHGRWILLIGVVNIVDTVMSVVSSLPTALYVSTDRLAIALSLVVIVIIQLNSTLL